MPEKLTKKAGMDTLRVSGLPDLSCNTGSCFSAWNRGICSKRGASLNLRGLDGSGGRLNWVIRILLCNVKSLGFIELT